MTSKTKLVLMGLGALALLAGCGKEAAPESSPDKVAVRMHDPAYLGMLKQQRDEQKTLMRQIHAVRQAYAAELAKDTNSPKLVVLKKQLDDLSGAMLRNRKVSQEIIRQRILMDEQPVNAKSAKNVEKKGN